jgi:arylsulfatase A-like enzyme
MGKTTFVLQANRREHLRHAVAGLRSATRQLAVYYCAICGPGAALSAEVLPQPEPAFHGKIGVSTETSSPEWPKPLMPPEGAPNVLLILLDDVGFADASAFGGAIATPALDRLASEGLRYNNFHTTSMCSPTRAALLSGRNHHRIGFGRIADISGGYPGYDGVWKRNSASIARVLRGYGYSTAAFGKWHNTPVWEISPIGPFDRWPTGLGFEYFYGFMQGLDNQWRPSMLYRNTTPVEPPYTPAEGYHVTKDIADEAMRWIRTHDGLAPTQPWFVYFATGAVHAPHQVPGVWIERFRGRFDRGWDQLREEIFARQKKLSVVPPDAKLNPRPVGLPAWQSLSVEQRRLFARQMEVYAAFLSHTDHEIGRLIDTVRQGPNAQNTLILYVVGDNGPEGVGGLTGTDFNGDVKARVARLDELGGDAGVYNNYSYGWAWTGATPFNGTKGLASHLGGLRNPLVVSWPAVIKDQGAVRNQFTHVNDVALTIYESARIEPPRVVDGVDQAPFDGASFAASFQEADVSSRHHVQYFEMWSNRALYQDGWFASARNTPLINRDLRNRDPARDRWELYDLTKDFSQAHDLAASHPERLAAMRRLFEAEAQRNHVYPLGGGFAELRPDALPALTHRAKSLTFYPGMGRFPSQSILVSERSYRIDIHLLLPEGVRDASLIDLCSYCEVTESHNTISIRNGAAVLDYFNEKGARREIVSPPLKAGPNVITFAFEKAADDAAPRSYGFRFTPGVGRIYVNDSLVEEANMDPSKQGAFVFSGQRETAPQRSTSLVERVVITVADGQ